MPDRDPFRRHDGGLREPINPAARNADARTNQRFRHRCRGHESQPRRIPELRPHRGRAELRHMVRRSGRRRARHINRTADPFDARHGSRRHRDADRGGCCRGDLSRKCRPWCGSVERARRSHAGGNLHARAKAATGLCRRAARAKDGGGLGGADRGGSRILPRADDRRRRRGRCDWGFGSDGLGSGKFQRCVNGESGGAARRRGRHAEPRERSSTYRRAQPVAGPRLKTKGQTIRNRRASHPAGRLDAAADRRATESDRSRGAAQGR